MRTANFSIVVLTESNFTKQSALSTGRWVECFKNMIEHTHFKKKKVEKFFITLFIGELEVPKVVVIVHNPDFFDSYLEAVLSRGDLLLFLNVEWLHERPITRMVTKYRLSAHIRVIRSKSDLI